MVWPIGYLPRRLGSPFSTTAKCIGDRNLILNDDQDPNKVIFTALTVLMKVSPDTLLINGRDFLI